jgi:hypothetical protein
LTIGDIVIYTDGSCKGNANVAVKACPAGWGLAALSVGAVAADGLTVPSVSTQQSQSQSQSELPLVLIDELYGPVVTQPEDPYYMGATVGERDNETLASDVFTLHTVESDRLVRPDNHNLLCLRFHAVLAHYILTPYQ